MGAISYAAVIHIKKKYQFQSCVVVKTAIHFVQILFVF